MKMKSLLNGKKYETLKDENVKLTKENEQLKRKVLKLTEEKEREHEKLVDSNKKVLKLTKEHGLKLAETYEQLNRIDAMREKEIELLEKYIKLLESRLNNQEDDDKVYPEYHTHDTFKVHNKLAEVISVLVDKDDDVYGYEVKFVDSSDTFIVYPEEIED